MSTLSIEFWPTKRAGLITTENSGYGMIRKIQIQMAEHKHQSSLMDRQKIGVTAL